MNLSSWQKFLGNNEQNRKTEHLTWLENKSFWCSFYESNIWAIHLIDFIRKKYRMAYERLFSMTTVILTRASGKTILELAKEFLPAALKVNKTNFHMRFMKACGKTMRKMDQESCIWRWLNLQKLSKKF